MNIGFVGESIKDNHGNYHFAENAIPLLDELKEKNEVYLLDHRQTPSSPNEFPVVNVNAKRGENISIPQLDLIYFGKAGKSIEEQNQYNSIVEQLSSFLNLLEFIQPFEDKGYNKGGIKFVNPSETLISNLSKQYLLDLAEKTDLPIIPTEKIKSIDRLVDLSQEDKPYIAKPLIAERAQGAIILNSKNPEELARYFKEYSPQKSNGTDLYSRVMSHQGIIVQPFLTDFNEYGERKIAVINGEITTARKILGSDNEIVSVHTGGKNYIYTPSLEEQELAKRVFDEFNKIHRASYVRADLVGKPGKLQINEIEALNPSFSDHKFPEETHYHNKVLSKTIESYVN